MCWDLSQNLLSDSAVKLLVAACQVVVIEVTSPSWNRSECCSPGNFMCRELALLITFVSSMEPHRYQGYAAVDARCMAWTAISGPHS